MHSWNITSANLQDSWGFFSLKPSAECFQVSVVTTIVSSYCCYYMGNRWVGHLITSWLTRHFITSTVNVITSETCACQKEIQEKLAASLLPKDSCEGNKAPSTSKYFGTGRSLEGDFTAHLSHFPGYPTECYKNVLLKLPNLIQSC